MTKETKWWCKVFGHDFRITQDYIHETGYRYKLTKASDWCQHCGLTKDDLK